MGNPDQFAQPQPRADEKLSKAMDYMWARHRSQILERVAVLDAAASAVSAKSLTEAEREAAHAAAHKLAGTLGMFNLDHGTDLARELDLAYSSGSTLAAASGTASSLPGIGTAGDDREPQGGNRKSQTE